jgi:hypothetical protein
MSPARKYKRCPSGYRLRLWANGFYHLYWGCVCIGEFLSRSRALRYAHWHKVAGLGISLKVVQL